MKDEKELGIRHSAVAIGYHMPANASCLMALSIRLHPLTRATHSRGSIVTCRNDAFPFRR